MFVKTLYGEVKANAWHGIDDTYQEVGSIEEGRILIQDIISLDHDYPAEWEPVSGILEKVKSLQVDERVKIRGIECFSGGDYSCYEYSIVEECQ